MKNKQMIVLIRAWANRLEREIQWIEEQLPEGSQQIKSKRYIGKNIIPSWDNSPENWEDYDAGFVITSGINDFLLELRSAEETLCNEGED